MKHSLIVSAILLLLFLAGCAEGESNSLQTPETTVDRVGEVITTAPPGTTPSLITPSPSPSPTPTESYGLIDASGSFRSDSGTALNLIADWSCVSVNAGNARLTVELSLESFSLYVGERPYNTLIINGNTITFHTPAIETDGGDTIVTPLYTWSETIPLNPDGTLDLEISAEWVFTGTYSGKEIDSLCLEGSIILP